MRCDGNFHSLEGKSLCRHDERRVKGPGKDCIYQDRALHRADLLHTALEGRKTSMASQAMQVLVEDHLL